MGKKYEQAIHKRGNQNTQTKPNNYYNKKCNQKNLMKDLTHLTDG